MQALRAARPFLSCARGFQTRTFLSGLPKSPYWTKRARVLVLVGRMVAAYPTFRSISDPAAPVNNLFARDTTERERMYMFALSLNNADEPLDLEQFLRGATKAATTVLDAIHNGNIERLEEMGVTDCVSSWKERPQQLRNLLRLRSEDSLCLDRVDVTSAGLAEVKYSFTSAQNGSGDSADSEATTNDIDKMKSRPVSKFQMHDEMQIKVRFEVREHVRVKDDIGSLDEREQAVDSSFTWAFYSDVSRSDHIDWVITHATPFSSKAVE